jgi:RHS repeat-associated protein
MIIFSVLKIKIMHTTSATYGTEQERVIFGEKSDHLGNVRAVVSDVRKPVATTGSIDDWTWKADITDYFSYYPFGMQEPGRQKQLNTVDDGGYRFGFQGQESDDEISGIAKTHYNYTFRMHDARIGRFWSIDPLSFKFPHNSPYAFSENSTIAFIELEGLERFFSADGSTYYGKIGDSDEMRVMNKDADFSELKSEGVKTLIDNSISASEASDGVYSNIATQVFSVVENKKIKLYNDKISVNENNVPDEWDDFSEKQTEPHAESYYFGDEIGGVINIKTKYDNFYNLMNTLRHEQNHNLLTFKGIQNDDYTHIQIYINDFRHGSFNRTTSSYQIEHRKNALNYIGKMDEWVKAAASQKGTDSDLYKSYKRALSHMIRLYEEHFDVTLKKIKGFSIYTDPSLK